MATDAISTAGATTASSKAGESKTKLAKDMNTFLTLLTTQLKYQDPMSPMDSTQFTNQLVQFAGVEQGIQQNTNLESLIKLQTGNQVAMAVGYLGNQVEAESSQLPLQDGEATFSYIVPQELKSATMIIRDSSGTIVRSSVMQPSLGKNEVSWDGTDNFKAPLEDGVYSIAVTGTTPTGETSQLGTTVTGTVTGVSSFDSKVFLSLGGVDVELANLINVHQKATPAVPTTTTSEDQTTN